MKFWNINNFKFRILAITFIVVWLFFSGILALFVSHLSFSEAQASTQNNSNATRNLEAVIVWSDNVEAHLSDSSTIALYENGNLKETAVLSIKNSWQQVWTNLNSSYHYDVRELSTFANYYTNYRWDSNNNVVIENILQGSPVPPWPVPTPTPTPSPTPTPVPTPQPGGSGSIGGTTGNNQTNDQVQNNTEQQNPVTGDIVKNSPNSNDINRNNSKNDNSIDDIANFFSGNLAIVWTILVAGVFVLIIVVVSAVRKRQNKNANKK